MLLDHVLFHISMQGILKFKKCIEFVVSRSSLNLHMFLTKRNHVNLSNFELVFNLKLD